MRWRALARETSANALRWSGLPRALRAAHRRRHATILLYHNPSAAVMDAHLAYLCRRFVFTTLDVVVDAIHSRDWAAVPAGAAVLTLDDGERGNYALLSLFRRYGVRPTIYVCSGVVATPRHFWFKERVDIQPLKRVRNRARREALRAATGFEPEREYPASERQALSAEEIAEMAPWVDFESHTRFHPVLPTCDDEEVFAEVEGSKLDIQAMLGRPVRHFSYPNGDYGAREVEHARRAGFASARTVDVGWTHVASDPYRLKIFGVSDDASVAMLAAQLSGIPSYVRRRLQGSRAGLQSHVAPE